MLKLQLNWYSLQDASYRLKSILQGDFGIHCDDIENSGIEEFQLNQALRQLKESRRSIRNVSIWWFKLVDARSKIQARVPW